MLRDPYEDWLLARCITAFVRSQLSTPTGLGKEAASFVSNRLTTAAILGTLGRIDLARFR
jgi:hypothetical protein